MTGRLTFAACVLALAASGGTAAAQDGQGGILVALDKPISFSVADEPIIDTLRKLTDVTGVPIELGKDAAGRLPHGDQTLISVTAENRKLSEILTAVLEPMAFRWSVGEERIEASATPALERINRRPMFTEVNILATLESLTLTKDEPAIDQLRQATGVGELSYLWHMPEDLRDKAFARADMRLPCTGREYLDMLGHGVNYTWYLWGTDIVVLSKQAQAVRQLQRRVTLRYQNQDMLAVIMDLARQAGLALEMDPGVLNYLPTETRKSFTLLMTKSTVGEAFQAASGVTGLMFEPGDLSIHVSASEDLKAAGPQATRARVAFIVMMSVPGPDGLSYQVFFRPDDLPEELVKQITRKKLETLNKIRKDYGMELLKELPALPPN